MITSSLKQMFPLRNLASPHSIPISSVCVNALSICSHNIPRLSNITSVYSIAWCFLDRLSSLTHHLGCCVYNLIALHNALLKSKYYIANK